MNILSNWKLTYDPAGTPLVLLDVGWKVAGELRFPLKRGLEVVDLAEAAAPFLRPAGNSVVTIQFEVFKDESLDKTARQAVMESLIAVNALGKKPLRIEISGITDRYWQFSNAYLHEHNPARYLEAPVARRVLGYTITATGLTQVGP